MKKKFLVFSLSLFCSFLAMTIIIVNGHNSALLDTNIEALTQIEQPNVNDCISDPNYDCEALHPTDPEKDQYREHARW